MSEMQDVLQNKLPIPLCNECMKLFLKSPRPTIENDADSNKCAICLGILEDSFASDVVDRIRTSFESYGGFSENMLSKDAPTVTIPVHIVIRAQCALAAIEAAKIEGIRIGPSTSSDMYTKIKDVLRNKVRINLQKLTMSSSHAMRDIDASTRAVLLREESGFMNCHIHVDAPIKTALPTEIVPIPKLFKKRERKRFRGNDPTDKQGGDPRLNLQNRVKEELNQKLELEGDSDKRIRDSVQVSLIERHLMVNALDTALKKVGTKALLAKWVTMLKNENESILEDSINVASWRQAFYLKGRYTKASRECSQTPFFVSCEKGEIGSADMNKMKRLGVTSVEEEICPVVSRIACLGMSKNNNEVSKENKESNIVYGMAKFHASGREDMDVRMVLRADGFDSERISLDRSNQQVKKSSKCSGRPFVLEIIDANRMPSREGLDTAQHEINHTVDKENTVTFGVTPGSSFWVNEKERTHVQYGLNPRGVGISGLDFCRSSCFGNLQSETEDKVKFYGCLCWSDKKIPNEEYLNGLLNNSICPLEISQCTPLRVLHRRSKAVRVRHILSLKPQRINDHWFRLEMSTSAGTYVKEFCHGDCARTSPSVSSLLGCKVDIVELDCNGIAY